LFQAATPPETTKKILYPELTLYYSLGAGQGEFWEEKMEYLAQKVILEPVR
jgi:hypothetical protein